jgi:hypothetical protein
LPSAGRIIAGPPFGISGIAWGDAGPPAAGVGPDETLSWLPADFEQATAAMQRPSKAKRDMEPMIANLRKIARQV